MKQFTEISKSFNSIVKKIRIALMPHVLFVNKKRKVYYTKFLNFSKRKPALTFAVLIITLFGLIVLSNFINKPKEELVESTLPVKQVSVYTIGESPVITVQARVEKSGVIKIVSLGSGVVQSINVEVGQEVVRGTGIASMSTNYQGGNSFSVARQLAQVQYKNVLDTYKTNKELIAKQKEIAEKNDKNSDELRKISNDSLSSTRTLVDLNNEILSSLVSAEQQAIANNKPDEAASFKQLRAQLLSGNSQLTSALRNAEYSGSDTNAPAEISNISKEIAIKQLEVQEKALALNKEVSRLSLVLAQTNEAIMFPSSPIQGVVERIYIKEGQVINPGTPIAQISGNSESLIAVALLSREMAQGVNTSNMSLIHFGEKEYESAPFYVSTEATDGSLYSIQYSIPEEYSNLVTDKSFITIDIPVGGINTGSTVPFIPVDSVFQTQDEAFVFIVKNGKAQSKKIILGQVLGRFVEVKSGLNEKDQVIIQRNVIAGDVVKIIN